MLFLADCLFKSKKLIQCAGLFRWEVKMLLDKWEIAMVLPCGGSWKRITHKQSKGASDARSDEVMNLWWTNPTLFSLVLSLECCSALQFNILEMVLILGRAVQFDWIWSIWNYLWPARWLSKLVYVGIKNNKTETCLIYLYFKMADPESDVIFHVATIKFETTELSHIEPMALCSLHISVTSAKK